MQKISVMHKETGNGQERAEDPAIRKQDLYSTSGVRTDHKHNHIDKWTKWRECSSVCCSDEARMERYSRLPKMDWKRILCTRGMENNCKLFYFEIFLRPFATTISKSSRICSLQFGVGTTFCSSNQTAERSHIFHFFHTEFWKFISQNYLRRVSFMNAFLNMFTAHSVNYHDRYSISLPTLHAAKEVEIEKRKTIYSNFAFIIVGKSQYYTYSLATLQ